MSDVVETALTLADVRAVGCRTNPNREPQGAAEHLRATLCPAGRPTQAPSLDCQARMLHRFVNKVQARALNERWAPSASPGLSQGNVKQTISGPRREPVKRQDN